MSEKTNRVVIKAKINYPALSQPKSINGSAAKYSGCFIIAKDDVESLNKYQEALEAAYRDGERKLMVGKVMPKLESLRCPCMTEIWTSPARRPMRTVFTSMPPAKSVCRWLTGS